MKMQTLSFLGIKDFFSKGHERTIKAKKHIAASFILRIGSVLTSLLIVPMTLHYLDTVNYGVWLTLISIVGWIELFDVGLGNGLRNKFAEALANNNKILAKKYVSTTYAIVTLAASVLFLLFLAVNPFVNWTAVLNTEAGLNNDLRIVALIIAAVFNLRFISQLINMIFMADQRPALKNFSLFLSNLLSLIVIYILTLISQGSLIYLTITLGLYPVILIGISLVYFRRDYKDYKPSFRFIELGLIKDLTNLGLKFFIIQISSLILFTTDNLIISQLYGPSEVTPYFIAYKYFGISTFIFMSINLPFWSAYTEAFQKKDFEWIKNINKKLKYTWAVISVFSLFLLLFSGYIYHIWIGDTIYIPFILSLVMFLYFIEHNFASIYLIFINGVGKIKLQTIFAVFAGLLNIPLSIFLAKYCNFGVVGVIMATAICFLYGPVIALIQYKKIINYTATGIWNS